MKNKLLHPILATCLLLVFVNSNYAIDDAFKAGKDTSLQESEELKKTEEAMDAKIKEINEKLQRFSILKNIPVKYTPERTTFAKDEKDGTYIELQSYSFIPLAFNYGKPVGSRHKTMRLYYSGDTLSKVESEIVEENFHEQTKYVSKVVDPNPLDATSIDIEISMSFNNGEPYKVVLEKMENTRTNPLRLNFKRDVYIPHITYFEKMFRFTEEFQKRYGTNNDIVAIETLKRSLQY
ncbi:MAG: hypothetical protein KDK41_10890 [Leptospiraceae bacterium]|nr:hypothetical protein [Leptospiraceae bacterium]